jgi:hypothetical protein
MIIVDRPPNFDEVLAAFPNADKPGVIFAYDGHVYNPSGGVIPPAPPAAVRLVIGCRQRGRWARTRS